MPINQSLIWGMASCLKKKFKKEMLAIRVGVFETELRRIKSQLGIA